MAFIDSVSLKGVRFLSNIIDGYENGNRINLRLANATTGVGINGDPGTARLYVNGTVGIGTTSPGALVHIVGSSDQIQEIVKGYSTQTTNLLELQNSSAAVQISASNTGGLIVNEQGDAAGDLRAESDTETNMLFLDASADALYLGGSTNGIQIDKAGELTLIGTATRWDDLRLEPMVRNSSSKSPTFTNWTGNLYVYYFDDAVVANEKEVHFQVQLPHAWKEGSAVYPHVHWMPITAGSAGNKVRWGLEYSKAKLGTAFGAATTIYADTTAVGTITTQHSHSLTSFASIDMTGDTLSTVLICRLFRNSSDAADTYTGTAGLLYIDFHYEIDSMGSKTELSK